MIAKKQGLILLLMVLLLSALPIYPSAETVIPSKTIHLVYDDSGSMIRSDGVYVDTWCQAKYAMEVFAAMLSEKDILNIYYMSDYVSGTDAPPKISLQGSTDAAVTASNVQQIHDLVTNASDTPFNAVKKAYADLTGASSDEKWLVVLTDGEFNGTANSTVENHYQDFVADGTVKVMMLSMGPNAAVITPDEEKGIFFEKAESTTDILPKLTGICNRIFQSNALPFDAQSVTSSFTVPMSQLVVFAQGKDVAIGNISDKDGNTYPASSNVKVMYSDLATTDKNYPADKTKVADNLTGYVATYDCAFPPNDYTFDVKGAENIQIYYKPNVTIKARLLDDSGGDVTEEEKLVSGKYKIDFGFVNAVTGEPVTDTSLLGNISYTSSMKNIRLSGEERQTDCAIGDMVDIYAGTLDIDVQANFLEYNTVNTKLHYDVYSSASLVFTFVDKPDYTLTTTELVNADKPLVLRVQIQEEGQPVDLTEEQWNLLGIPEITTKADVGEFRVEPSGTLGEYYVYPTLKDNDPLKTHGGTIDVHVKGEFTQGLSVAAGELDDTFEIQDTISFLDRLKDWWAKYWLHTLICLLILLLILGYVPGIKKYLPRKIKKRPHIDCSAEKIGLKDMESHGKYKRNLMSTLIPYKAETGFVIFSPSPYKKKAQLKAAGGNGMYVMNTRAFAGKEEFSFNGMAIEQGRTKPYRISGGSTISLRTPEYLYTCYLNR